MWLGGTAGTRLSIEEMEKLPGITKLGQIFEQFQNGPYRGEWSQKLPVTAGEMRTALIEIAGLLRKSDDDEGQLMTGDQRRELVTRALELQDATAVLLDGLDDAILGLTALPERADASAQVVYSADKIITILQQRDNMTADEAQEFYYTNIRDAYCGPGSPIFVDMG